MSSAANEPRATGLVLIDTVNDIFSENGKGYPLFKDEFARINVLENLTRLLAGARERRMPVFFCPMSYTDEDFTTWRHLSGIHREMFEKRMFEAGSWGADFHPQLGPRPGEITIVPHKNIDVIANTDLDVQLRRHGVEYVAIGGMIGTLCVESTVRSAMEHGYHVTTFTDATAALGGEGAHREMVQRYRMISHATLDVEEFLGAYR
jgi:nicotinamidase-related amidase